MAKCRHPDIQRFGEIRCCLSCGEAVFDDTASELQSTPHGSSSQYQYKPLRNGLGHEIRLIVLFAGEPSDDLICDIITVNLTDRPSYEAVSYTWANSQGDVSLTSDIHCGSRTIAMTKNCEAALRRLRLQGRNRRLWVDAICINQSDTEEKNHQVRLMSTIYSNAVQVLSYLGVDSDQAHKLRRLINFLQDNAELPDHEGSRRELISTFVGLPYFDRAWVMQEVGLAQLVTLIIGDHEVRWTGDTISRTLAVCSQLDVKPPSVLRWAPSSRPEEQADILAVLSRSRNCSARDPRDKVYALLGLTDSSFSSRFSVNYSLSYLEVYTKLATHCIEELGRFDVLQHCQHVASSDGHWRNTRRIPSWIPQWDFKDAYEPLPAQFTALDKQNFASSWHMVPTQPGTWLRNELPLQLLLERVLSEFSSGSDLYTADTNLSTATCREQVRKWSELESVHNSASPLSDADDEHLAQQIVHHQSSDFTFKILYRDPFNSSLPKIARAVNQLGLASASPTLAYLKLRAHRLDTIIRNLGPISAHLTPTIPQIAWSALGVSHCQTCSTPGNTPAASGPAFRAAFWQQRKAMVSKIGACGRGSTVFASKHSVGFTRGKVRTGDSVWALFGADVPFVLREIDGHYEVIGDCYLHGAGRAFPCEHCGADAAPWPMQTEVVDIW